MLYSVERCQIVSTIRLRLSPGDSRAWPSSPPAQAGHSGPRRARRGDYLFDTDGRRYLDFTAGIGVTSTGHCHPRVVEAAQEQVGHADPRAVHDSHAPPAADADRAARECCRPVWTRCSTPTPAARPSRPRSGWPGRPPAGRTSIVFHGGFHGRTVAAASMTTSGTKFRAGFAPLMAGVWCRAVPDRVPLRLGREDQRPSSRCASWTTCSPRRPPPDDTAAFIVEPVLGEGGYVPGQRRVPGRPAGARRPARHPADRSTRCRPAWAAPASSGGTITSASGRTSWSPRRAWPAASRCPPSPPPRELMAEGLARLAGRHVRRQRGRLRRGPRHARRHPRTRSWWRTPPSRAPTARRASRKVAGEHKAIGDVRGLGLMWPASSPPPTAPRHRRPPPRPSAGRRTRPAAAHLRRLGQRRPDDPAARRDVRTSSGRPRPLVRLRPSSPGRLTSRPSPAPGFAPPCTPHPDARARPRRTEQALGRTEQVLCRPRISDRTCSVRTAPARSGIAGAGSRFPLLAYIVGPSHRLLPLPGHRSPRDARAARADSPAPSRRYTAPSRRSAHRAYPTGCARCAEHPLGRA